jgi:ribosomal protein L24E
LGADIEIYVEKFVDGKWQVVANPEKPDSSGEYRNWLWSDRNSLLFAILGYNLFSSEIKSLSVHEGLPADASEFVRHDASFFHYSDSITWITLAELLDIEWDKSAGKITRYVSPEETESFLKYGKKPREYAWLSFKKSWVSLSWEVTYRECAGGFFEALQKLKGVADPKDIRLVYWFDV